MTPHRSALLALLVLAAGACRGGDESRAPVTDQSSAGASFDWKQPRTALDFDADQAARRLGSFEWDAQVTWRVHRGEGTRASSATERHRLVQTADGAFDVEAVVDDGRGPGSETGRHIVYVNGATYAKGHWAPFRERPTDRGHAAKRFRDESFRLAGDLAALCGPGLTLVERGTATVEGRPGRRYAITLDRGALGTVTSPPAPSGRATDRETQLRVELLEGAVPRTIEGELVADAATGVPLQVRLVTTLGVPSDAALRAEVTLDARITALGAAAAAVRPPDKILPDERKPKGVAQALEAAGLKEKQPVEPPGTGERAEPAEEAARPAE
ncbi:MAG TPA: hypothetical protein VFK85_04575 [Anaeromyxobacteraceae bacterium]|nr:hypothetical protein [Anaeromyxobacteraceae bacterium]